MYMQKVIFLQLLTGNNLCPVDSQSEGILSPFEGDSEVAQALRKD